MTRELTEEEKELIADYLKTTKDSVEYYWNNDDNVHLFYLGCLERAKEMVE